MMKIKNRNSIDLHKKILLAQSFKAGNPTKYSYFYFDVTWTHVMYNPFPLGKSRVFYMKMLIFAEYN